MRRFLVLALLAVVAVPTPARAHASYKTSDPPNRSKVGSAPASLWAEFTEPLASGSYLQVFDPCGERVDNDDTQISGYRMSVTQASARSGTYTVRFRALSTLDPHEVNGSFTFTATEGEPCPGAEPQPDPEEPDESEPDDPSRADAPEEDQPEVAAGAPGSDEPEQKDSAERNKKVSQGGKKPARAEGDRKPRKMTKVLAQRRDRPERGLLDDIPVGSFAISLAISALIGAAGGKVYAGIMGPRA